MKTIFSIVAAVAMAAGLSACGGSVNGTVGGISLAVADSIFYPIKDDQGKTRSIIAVLTDKANICDTLKANRQPKNATGLLFVLQSVNLDTQTYLAPAEGSYTVLAAGTNFPSSGTFASGGFSKVDANCSDTLASTATGARSGLIKVTTLKAEANGGLNATFDVSFGTQADKVTGSINARFCDLGTALMTNPSCE